MRKPLGVASLVFLLAFVATAVDAATIEVRLNGSNFELRTDNVLTFSQPLASVTTLIVSGTAADDTFVVNMTGGSPIPSGGLTFDGLGQVTAAGDRMTIQGGSFTNATVTYTNQTDGSISLNGSTIQYIGLEPVDMSGSTVANLVFNLPATSSASLDDDGTLGNGVLRLTTLDASFENTTFANPTNSLTVNGGSTSATIVTNANFSDFTAGLTLSGGAGTSSVTLNDLSLSTGSAALSVTAGAITINASSITSAGAQAFSGPVTLTGPAKTLTSTAVGDITFNQTLNGNAALTVNTAGGTNFFGTVGGATPVGSIATDAPGLTRVAVDVTTNGAQSYGDQLALFGNVTLQSAGNGPMAFANIDNNFALTVATGGVTTFNNPVGSLVPLASLVTDAAGSTILGSSVTTNLFQTYNDPVSLSTSTTLSSTSNGNIAFSGTVNGTFPLFVNTGGVTSFAGAVGNLSPLSSLSTDAAGATTIGGGSVITTGNQTFLDIVTILANTTFTSNGNIQFPGTINGAFSVTKAGAGVMTMTTPNTYTGGTNVNAGMLLVNNVAGSGTGPGLVTVAGGATLAGTGIIGGSVVTLPGGIFAPGSGGIGTLNILGGATWSGGAAPTGVFELNNAGTTSDQLAITGAFSKGAGPAFTFDFVGTGTVGTYTLATFASTTFAASDFTFTNLAAGLDGFFTIAGGNTLQFVAVSSAATHFSVTAPATATAGTPFTITVTALDVLNNVDTTYAGIVHFTSTDGAAILPADTTLTGGTATLVATLQTAGTQTITATDTSNASITGTSGPINVTATAATHFSVSAPALATAGLPFSFTVTALDQFNNVDTAYGGIVHFTSTDGAATLPADSTLSSGTGTFVATLRTAGAQTITATDTSNGSIAGTSGTITVSAAAATHFAVSAPASATAGLAFTFTVTALDQFNNVDTAYAGIVHFTSTDGAATLPADSTLSSGTGTFVASLGTAGGQTITATDTSNGSITGTSGTITVSATSATHFAVSAPTSAVAGTSFSFTVTALDQFNNPATTYAGTVHFTSTDGAAILPADVVFSGATGTFTATLNTAGNQTITATDTANASITGTSNAISVSLVAADIGISKTASPGPYLTGGTITYTIVAQNAGPGDATGVTVTDTIPAGTAFGSATATQGSCSGTTTVTCTLGSIVNGGSATITLVLTLPSTAGSVSNTASVTSTTGDANAANDQATSTVNVVNATSIPTLSEALLMMLVAALMAVGAMRLRG